MWKYDISSYTWEHLCGNQSRNVYADYTVPYPGSISSYDMVIDGIDRYLYVFGGKGNDESKTGIDLLLY